jgi:hypothetical protein
VYGDKIRKAGKREAGKSKIREAGERKKLVDRKINIEKTDPQ